MKKILFLSWRDIKSPKAGGAEIFTHEMLKRMVKAGYKIDHVSPQAEGLQAEEKIDGVRYIRHGGTFSVIAFARKWYKKNREDYDFVVDQCNTHQFFTPLWVEKKKRVFFIHQLTREIWFYHTRFPMNVIGYIMEPLMLRLHRKSPTITVSNSTKQDLVNWGFNENKVVVFPEGLNFKAWKKEDLKPKEKKFTCLYLGRFAKYKGVEDAIKAFAQFHQKDAQAQLWLVGKVNPKYKAKLQSLIEAYGVNESVIFHGFVSEEKKLELMSRSHCIMVPSQREGWGLIVTESNAVGTMAVVYDSPGLRDSVRHGETGLLTQQKTPEALYQELMKLKKDPSLQQTLAKNAHEWSQEFHWDNTGKAALKFFKEA